MREKRRAGIERAGRVHSRDRDRRSRCARPPGGRNRPRFAGPSVAESTWHALRSYPANNSHVVRPQGVHSRCGSRNDRGRESGRGRVVHPPAPAHRVLHARRCGQGARSHRPGGGGRPARDRHHRSRQHVRRPRLLRGGARGRVSSRSSAPRPTRRPTPASSARCGGVGSTTGAATPRPARSSTTTSPSWPRTERGTRTSSS